MTIRYRIRISPAAQRDFQRLDKTIQDRMAIAILKLETNRHPQQFKPLAGRATAQFRLRVGDYRILYDVYDEKKTVLILRIGHRRDIYR